jgi:hypothetical protein
MHKAIIAIAAATTVGLVLAFGCASTIAQERTNDQRPPTTTVDTRRDDAAFDYGWLGLAGLLGLLGLLPRDRGGITVRDGAGNVKDRR